MARSVNLSTLALFAFSIITTAHCSITPSAETIKAATADLENLIYSERDGPERPFIVNFLRLRINDCAGEGGCDGCLNHEDISDDGLATVTAHLDGLYDANYSNSMSRSDFYELSVQTAVDMTSDENAEKYPGFKDMVYGREDCATSPVEDDKNEKLPHHATNVKDMTKFYKDNFDLNSREAIALLGLHTFPAKTGKSDHKGDAANKNAFYSDMINHPRSGIPNEHRPVVAEFANDNAKWKKEFKAAFKKVANKSDALKKKVMSDVDIIIDEINVMRDEVKELKAKLH